VAIIAPTLLASSGVMLAVYFTRRAHIRYEALNATRPKNKKAAPKDGFLISSTNQRLVLVAGIGFEPMTFRL
jgi:hypothetical protein